MVWALLETESFFAPLRRSYHGFASALSHQLRQNLLVLFVIVGLHVDVMQVHGRFLLGPEGAQYPLQLDPHSRLRRLTDRAQLRPRLVSHLPRLSLLSQPRHRKPSRVSWAA